jgi:hypothetical protein
MRHSLDALMDLVVSDVQDFDDHEDSWLPRLSASGWLGHIRFVIFRSFCEAVFRSFCELLCELFLSFVSLFGQGWSLSFCFYKIIEFVLNVKNIQK